ncbi:MAG: bifunctional [glutamate--ammonia ligase]-adenylyl-L-tyrosine phosphorylase/[glutamate--ammonia-ligase] adenylyltransferase [Desulfobacteraceae bacterium]|nr:bifunctional [glutamate--ammonia ligase]-adenylyl-L-tyrosine phosphorylase/[glutamate--ammonia-ligase] adenylyltransferase [Desulfobacteraceae bacterium]MCF8095597.1 bifunctional [glutamate--ammonia ligase]-adenylyl-L-tyrosine phosphorylase/[glutamate--ammonia-ligase] adenylyltransferase [Desulfobacteraceae bacterium]
MPEVKTTYTEDKIKILREAAESAGLDMPDCLEEAENSCVFAFSEYVARQCIRDPAILLEAAESGDLDRMYGSGEYVRRVKTVAAAASDETELSAGLRRLRHREMVRIAWRDLSGRADLFETMSDLSAFADACVSVVLEFLYARFCARFGKPVDSAGAPQQLAVFAMGKLGGHELNFSSDIDLMFAYPEVGETSGCETPVSNEEFFTRLARHLIDVIGKSTAQGFVFRVDTRLRPYGDAGPLVMSFDAMENYYQTLGREWERYALVKARLVADDSGRGEEFLKRLKPFVYRRYLDYGTFESIREMKKKIVREVARRGLENNIKHGYGGIREIEFFGQVFQLIRGGIDPAYQERSILKVLRVMCRDRCISRNDYEELASAYVFLRNTENRLQMREDKQTHTLPDDTASVARLAESMGFESADSFLEKLRNHMSRVHLHFNELLSTEPDEEGAEYRKNLESVWLFPEDKNRNINLLAEAGFDDPEAVLRLLSDFREKAGMGREGNLAVDRINRLMPRVLSAAAETDRPVMVLKRIMPLLDSILNRSCYISLLLENPGALGHLMKLARISPWIVSFLSRHPLLLDELLDLRSLYAPLNREDLAEELRLRLSKVPEDDLEYQMDEIRVFKQVNMFRIVAADITGHLPLMKVSDRLTYLAETVLETTLHLTWQQMVERYGHPSGFGGSNPEDLGFAAIAYGKLGGYELGYSSDLDVVFLHTAKSGQTNGGRVRPIDNLEFFGRLGQRIIHFLSAPTATGKLYEIDTRLRPSGNAGVLVSRINAFEEYQRKNAWIWEHQALIKARPVVGDRRVAARFEQIRKNVIALKRDPADLADAVLEMRSRMRKTHGSTRKGSFDLKQDRGGVIDIEFLVQFLILRHGNEYEELGRWTDVVRQLNVLALCGIIEDIEAHALKQAYLIYRYFVHRLNLQEKSAVLPENRFSELRRRVVGIWEKCFSSI